MIRHVGGFFCALIVASVPMLSVSAADAFKKPEKVLIVVFDQMRPEYAERFNMKNVLSLARTGVSFRNGYLGHMASQTVVSHNVMASGVFPKHMGWVDEVYRDVDNLLGGGQNAMWVTAEMGRKEFGTLITHAGYPKLADYLHQTYPGSKFIVVGQKGYAVESVAAPNADIAVRMSGRQKDVSAATGCANLGGQWRFPAGHNVPAYLTEPKCGRFYINSDKSKDYGTRSKSPSWVYPLDGNRFVPGNDPQHLGGDAWVADAAMAMMEKENWSGMLMTFGGIDKGGHMWGAYHDKQPPAGSPDEQTHLPFLAKFADEQLGRVLDRLKELGQLDKTLIVITADHGAVYGEQFYGRDAAERSDLNWYYGKAVNADEAYDKPWPSLRSLIDTGNVQFSYQSTYINAWLFDNSPEKKREAAKVMRNMQGVVATYWREGDRYQLDTATKTSTRMGPNELNWWKKNGQAILDTMAAPNAADVVACLGENVSYGAHGDHGGLKEGEQRVPMIFWSASIKPDRPTYAFRTVDILPTVLKAMSIPQSEPADGKAWSFQR